MAADPIIIYIPGMRPKPHPDVHRDALLRCLLEGIRRADSGIAEQIEADSDCFEIVSWTYSFYGEHRDISLDKEGIESVLQQRKATEQDIVEANTLGRRFVRSLYRTMDYFPFLIPHVANEKMEMHLRDLRRYASNRNDIAEQTRQLLKTSLLQADVQGRPILLLAHSMGSVIAWDALWQLSRMSVESLKIDLLVTMGSPLGQRYIQRRLLGHTIGNERRYPDNIGRWINIAAAGELTAIDPALRNDYSPMLEYGLLEDIQDLEFYNYYRDGGAGGSLNTHAEYGYLVSEVTASVVCDWWRNYCR